VNFARWNYREGKGKKKEGELVAGNDEFIVSSKAKQESICWFLINGQNRHSERGLISLCTWEIFHKLWVNNVQLKTFFLEKISTHFHDINIWPRNNHPNLETLVRLISEHFTTSFSTKKLIPQRIIIQEKRTCQGKFLL